MSFVCFCSTVLLEKFYLVWSSWEVLLLVVISGSHPVTLSLKDPLKNPKKFSPGSVCQFSELELYFSGINWEEDGKALLMTHKWRVDCGKFCEFGWSAASVWRWIIKYCIKEMPEEKLYEPWKMWALSLLFDNYSSLYSCHLLFLALKVTNMEYVLVRDQFNTHIHLC